RRRANACKIGFPLFAYRSRVVARVHSSAVLAASSRSSATRTWMRASSISGLSAITMVLLEQRAKLERRTKTAVRQPRRNPIGAPIDDPAGDDIPRRAALPLGAGNATLPLLGHELPTVTRTFAGIIASRNEAATVERDHVAALVFSVGLVSAANTHP